jgi:hypothetical protein
MIHIKTITITNTPLRYPRTPELKRQELHNPLISKTPDGKNQAAIITLAGRDIMKELLRKIRITNSISNIKKTIRNLEIPK